VAAIDNAGGKAYFRANANRGNVTLTYGADATSGFFWVETNNPFRIATNAIERIRISAAGGLSFGNSYVATDPGANNVIIAGSVGIGTASPQSKLQVSGGEVQIGSSGASCAGSNAGAVRYASGTMYYCNGSAWTPFSSSCFGSSSGGTNTSLASGLVAYWNFNENTGTTLYDASGNGNTATLEGTTGSQWVTGISGSGLSFNGTSNYVISSSLVAAPSTYSISAWFKTSTASGHKIVGFESSLGLSGSYDRQLYVGTNGDLYFGGGYASTPIAS
jgi:hypothetical protein